jgi:antitoxin component of MazEF toxin-antitoxin module
MPILEHKAIYRVGKSTLVVTLPRNWLEFNGLNAGDTVEIIGNGVLTIRPMKRQENAEINGENRNQGHA